MKIVIYLVVIIILALLDGSPPLHKTNLALYILMCAAGLVVAEILCKLWDKRKLRKYNNMSYTNTQSFNQSSPKNSTTPLAHETTIPLHIIHSIKGYSKAEFVKNAETEAIVNKFMDKETKSMYMMVRLEGGKEVSSFISKNYFELICGAFAEIDEVYKVDDPVVDLIREIEEDFGVTIDSEGNCTVDDLKK